MSSPAGPELWKRVETFGNDTGFLWMVWLDKGGLDGTTHWFDSEVEARLELQKHEKAAA